MQGSSAHNESQENLLVKEIFKIEAQKNLCEICHHAFVQCSTKGKITIRSFVPNIYLHMFRTLIAWTLLYNTRLVKGIKSWIMMIDIQVTEKPWHILRWKTFSKQFHQQLIDAKFYICLPVR